MANLTLLSTFVLRIREKQNLEHMFLSKRDQGSLDFLEVFNDFLSYRIGNHYKGPKDKQGRKKSLYYKEGFKIQIDERTVHGFLHSGLSGEKGDVVDDQTGEDLYTMEDHHAKILPTYFFLHIPENRKDGYLILQKKSNYGIKNLLEAALEDYFNKVGLNIMLEVNNFLVSLVFNKMLSIGRVYEMSFIKNSIEENIEDIYDRGNEHIRLPGKTTTKITTKYGFPIKGLLKRLYHGNTTKDGMVEIPELNERYDEVDFEMDYNGSKKTFHMKNIKRTTPDFNVSEHIVFDEKGLPTYDSLYGQCHLLLNDMKEYHEAKIKQ